MLSTNAQPTIPASLLLTVLAVIVLASGCMATAPPMTCDYDGAYAQGMNEALAHTPMDPARIEAGCPASASGDVLMGYREGYTIGAEAERTRPRAPQVTVIRAGGGRGDADDDEDECTFDSDCAGGECERVRGTRRCVGGGSSGGGRGGRGDSECTFDSDCRGGDCIRLEGGINVCSSGGAGAVCRFQSDCDVGWCREAGGGLSVCMHEGGNGDACQSTIDCGSGLFCRDARRGGGQTCQ